jgi:FAD/FMN-containing dehydrogenase
LWDIKRKDGSFDLSQLFVGAQGTLGIITEVQLYHVPYNPDTTLLVGYFDSVKKLQEAVVKIAPLGPSAQEVVDRNVLEFVQVNRPAMLEGLLPEKMPEIVLLVEFDDQKLKVQDKKARQTKKILENFAYEVKASNAKLEQDQLWRIRRQAAAVIWMQNGPKKALPIIEDGIVPLDKFDEFVKDAYKLLGKYGVKVAIWGHAGNGHLHIQPFLDLGNIRDKHKVYALANEFYKMILKLGGSISGEHNDGIMRGPYLKSMYGPEIYNMFVKVKKLFDPQNILNPKSKLGASQEYGMVHLRKEYSMKHLTEHLPGISSFH